ncbi:MAG: hypothetical protein Q7R43_00200 [Candidatus Daviesbacteria bacterium]|nr:hypothetical protein [Candidatus Daviesbacteria bacterium]
MERDQQKILLGQETNKFRNVKEKIRNKKLSNQTAWEIAQPLLTVCVEDYPEKYNPHLNLIQTVFNFRREAYFEKIEDKEASDGIKNLFSPLVDSDQNSIGKLAVCIRDLFIDHYYRRSYTRRGVCRR